MINDMRGNYMIPLGAIQYDNACYPFIKIRLDIPLIQNVNQLKTKENKC